MKIKLESNDFDEKSLCHFCGKVFYPQEIIARAYRDESEDEYITDVCPECLSTGIEGISRRILEQAYQLRTKANELEKLARGEIEAPSLSEYSVVKQIAKALL